MIIRDTLDSALDITTIRPGASGRDYRFSMRGVNIIEFYFPYIMLPDSFVNEPGSNGFVNFKIAQLQGNLLETVIENKAAIYFDFNEPVITNTVYHTIGEDYLEIVNSIPAQGTPLTTVRLYPNPME